MTNRLNLQRVKLLILATIYKRYIQRHLFYQLNIIRIFRLILNYLDLEIFVKNLYIQLNPLKKNLKGHGNLVLNKRGFS